MNKYGKASFWGHECVLCQENKMVFSFLFHLDMVSLRCGCIGSPIFFGTFSYNAIKVLVESIAKQTHWSNYHSMQEVCKEAIPGHQSTTQHRN